MCSSGAGALANLRTVRRCEGGGCEGVSVYKRWSKCLGRPVEV